MDLKNFQKELLKDFEDYLGLVLARESTERAFVEAAKKIYGMEISYRPLKGAEHIPYVCLRVPTGGGKTRIAGHAIGSVNRVFLPADYSLTVWLVPSEPIRVQTLRTLRERGERLQGDLREQYGAVHVLEISEALEAPPVIYNTAHTIIVATMQSFKRESSEGLRVYAQNGALQSHFDNVPVEKQGNRSLVDAIRLRRPFIVVDEAHNQGTPLATDTLVKLHPCCVLELTATPDRLIQPSNVLRTVSAYELQAEDMLKLPIEVAVHTDWKVLLSEAIDRRKSLEADAFEEYKETGEKIDPVVMLLQADRKQAGKETLTPEVIKATLIQDFQIPADQIAIATGAVDELGDLKVGDDKYPRFIITVDKLREGWDCPSAYVLYSVRNTTSATAAEQVVGRVLRMPHVKRKKRESLNKCYGYMVSNALMETLGSLKDSLVQTGFDRLAAKELIKSAEALLDPELEDLFTPKDDITVELPVKDDVLILPKEELLLALPKNVREKVELSPETGTLTVKAGAAPEQVVKIAETFSKDYVAEMRDKLAVAQAKIIRKQHKKTPAELGEKGRVPLLMIRQGTYFDIFDETMLLHNDDMSISNFDWRLTDREFPRTADIMRRGVLGIQENLGLYTNILSQLEIDLDLLGEEFGWTIESLTQWLDQNIEFQYADRNQKTGWFFKAIEHLLNEYNFTILELARSKFRLKRALQIKLVEGLDKAKQMTFESFAGSDMFEVGGGQDVVFELGRYPCNSVFAGKHTFNKHFFPQVGDLKEGGEEFECACEIDGHPDVEWWVRNLTNKPDHSFWLQTSKYRFYPDFVVRLKNGVILVVEYKGKHLETDSKEKGIIGTIWAERSGGAGRFLMFGEKKWDELRHAARV